MSIYATLWVIQVEHEDKFVRIIAQAVPPFIGHPKEGYESDPFSDFLPPVVEYDPDKDCSYRAVVIVQQGRNQKEGQRYIDPLLVFTGKEYEEIKFVDLLSKIMEKVK